MQLGRACLLDLLAQGLRCSLVTYQSIDTCLAHSSACTRICFAITFLPTAWIRLSPILDELFEPGSGGRACLSAGMSGFEGRGCGGDPEPIAQPAAGGEGGPIALVRAVDDRAEVYGIGSFRGPPKSLVSPVRLGNENIAVAETTTCPDPDDCRKRAQFYLARRGRLIESASVDLERTAVVPSVTERGLYAKYILRTDVNYKPNGIQLLEQVVVKIIHYEEGARDSDRALRKVEFSRFLRVERDTLFSSNDPLWERVVGQD